MGAGSPGQRKLLSEFVSVFSRNEDLFNCMIPEDSIEQFWNSKSVNAYGEEIHHCRSVGWANLRSSLPTAEQAGVLSPEMVATGGVLDFLEHPTKYLLPLDERVSMKTPRVMIKDDDWDEVSRRRGICEVIAVEDVFHVHGSPLSGRPKHETTPDGHEVLRLIMDLRPIAVEGDLGTLPMVTSLGGLEVRPHEDLLISSEDIRAMFYIVGLGPQWRPFLAFGKEVPDQLRPPGDSRPHVLTSRLLPMGFINSVAVAQHIHREIVKRALSKVGPGAECEFRRDSTFPQSEVGYRVYLDNFDLLEKTNSSAAEVLKGSRAPSSDAFRREYEKLKVPANQKKSVSRASTAEVQGALVDGVRNIAYPKPEKFVRYLRASFFLLCQTVASLKQLQIALGGLVYLFQFRRPLMANLNECWSFLVELGRQDPSGTAMFPIPTEVKKELWLSLSLAPLAYICFGAEFSEVVTCSDASEHGGGVCQSVGLTPMGQQAETS